MNRILSYLLTVILLCGITVSCSKDDDKDKTAETVIMFFPYSSMESYITDNIECMKQAIEGRGGLGNQRVIVYRSMNSSTGILFELKYSNKQCVETSIADVSATFGSYDQVSNVVKLQSVLEKIKSVAPAQTYSMIVGCHGSAWVPAGYSLEDMNNSFAKSQKKSFGSAGERNQIDNATLVEALNKSKIHLNYLLFDACYMASAEAAYDFRSICDYYIASQNEILLYGVPYDKLGDSLLKHDYRDVVDKYYKFYSEYMFRNMPFHYGSLSVINTAGLEDLASVVRRINTTCLTDVTTNTIQHMDGISPTIFFDFYDYFEHACTDAAVLKQLKDALNATVVYERHTPEYYTAFDNQYHQPATHSCGLNISQPTRNHGAEVLMQKTEWWAATH